MKSMLVIDGSASIARLFAEIFERRGWNVSTCFDQDSAIELVAGNQPWDVFLVSHRVEGTTGVQLVRLIRSFEHRRIAIVVMMIDSDEGSDEALAAGADQVLLKPINPNALTWIVDRLVK